MLDDQIIIVVGWFSHEIGATTSHPDHHGRPLSCHFWHSERVLDMSGGSGRHVLKDIWLIACTRPWYSHWIKLWKTTFVLRGLVLGSFFDERGKKSLFMRWQEAFAVCSTRMWMERVCVRFHIGMERMKRSFIGGLFHLMLNMLIVQKTIDMSSRLDDVGTRRESQHVTWSREVIWNAHEDGTFSCEVSWELSHVSCLLPFCGWEDDGFLFQGKLLEYFALSLWMFLSTTIKPQERIETKS